MRIVISDFISLDGVVQAPGGAQEDTDGGFAHGGWSLPYFDVAAMGPVLEDVMQRAAALLFGRRTWETMAAVWPGRAGDPFADRMNAIPKYVASRSLSQADLAWSNSSLLPADDVLGAVGAMRDRPAAGDVQVMAASAFSQTTAAPDSSSWSRRPSAPLASISAPTGRPVADDRHQVAESAAMARR